MRCLMRGLSVSFLFCSGLADSSTRYRGIAPERLEYYKSRLVDEASGEWKCVSGETPPHTRLNDNYCDCEDASDEPGTSACAGREAVWAQHDLLMDPSVERRLPAMFSDGSTSGCVFDRQAQVALANPGFWCEQKGFFAKLIPSWRVGDTICDCCDGADEMPSGACPNTCATLMEAHTATQQHRDQEEAELIRLGEERLREGLRLLAEWDDLMLRGPSLIAEAEQELARLEAEKEANLTKAQTESVEQPPIGILPDEDSESETEEEWLEEWNEDGSIKKVRKERRLLAEEPETETPPGLLSNLRSTVSNIFGKLRRLWSKAPTLTPVETPPPKRYTPSPNYNDPVVAQNQKIYSLKDRYNKAQAKANDQLFREFPQIAPWTDRTLTWRNGETTYTMPILGSAYSRENWENRIELGTFKSVVKIAEFRHKTGWLESTIGRGVFAPWGLLYEDGDTCGDSDTRRITSLIYLVCAKEDQLLVWEEQDACQWTGTLATPAFCNVRNDEQKHPVLPPSRDEL
eukprot:Gregarina_sp_Pseudo_9__338@NODE_1219_length_1770_cov_6_713460_g1145_i0_p1_GENE_NODE_1219_length_1770_cov_6_713460_g1145_i0NODE_1219_length_1770_cov_6_713460_g1145_i0_p1_ORF_typecomplete_len517_score75_68PRKCSHlike/PF12999_7/2_7e36PRKCSH_1/PF13015_6/1_9e11Ldl_recept_a/PF00057_18/0_068Ldl_recept_a/PF00057_18/8_3_NODE_1219_length_1770_cov_6_713460_g1145_i021552